MPNKNISILNDALFKTAFASNNAQSKQAMSILISAYMNENVSVFEYLSNEQKQYTALLKDTRMDVVCQLTTQDFVDVEVQLAQTGDDFDKRIIFYNALLLANQDSFRKSYKKLHKAISLILCGFPLHKGCTIIDSAAYSLDLFNPLQRIILVDLTLIGQMSLEELQKARLAEQLGYLLYHYENQEKQDIIKVMKEEYKEVHIVAEQIERISKEEKEAIRKMRDRLIENDGYLMEQRIIEQLMATGKAEGISDEQAKAYLHLIKEGEAKGKEEGIAEGKTKGKIEGEVQATRKTLHLLLQKMSLAEATSLLEMSVEEAQRILNHQ